MEKKKYEIRKHVFETKNNIQYYRYMITKESIPLLEINQYIEQKSIRNVKTGLQYAKKLVVFLNWLEQKNVLYENATNQHVKAFIHDLIYGIMNDELQIQSNHWNQYYLIVHSVPI